MSNIANFKSQFQGGVRPNQFRIFMSKGPNGIGTKNFEFLGKAASIPASTIGNVDVPYRGRQLKVPGDRTFEDWTLTVFNDGEWSARSYFERWMQVLQGHRQPVRSVNATDVYGNAVVQQLSRTGVAIATYTMEDIYPTNVAAIDLGFDTNDSVEEFQVTFAVNNWSSSSNPEPSGQGSNLDIDFNVRGNIGGVGVSVGTNGININA
jgi:hypothetical protein